MTCLQIMVQPLVGDAKESIEDQRQMVIPWKRLGQCADSIFGEWKEFGLRIQPQYKQGLRFSITASGFLATNLL